MGRVTETSQRSRARMAGTFQGLEGLTSGFGQVVGPGRLFVFGNAAATAAIILRHERLVWLGFAASLIGIVLHLAWALLLYDLFKFVNRRPLLFTVSVILVGCAIQAISAVFYIAPFLVLESGSSLSAYSTEQLRALALAFVRLSAYAVDTCLMFFGFWCVLTGLLILRSTFMPRFIETLLAISGLGWMIYLVPPLAVRLFIPYITGASALGEMRLFLRLLVKGMNEQRWKEQATAS